MAEKPKKKVVRVTPTQEAPPTAGQNNHTRGTETTGAPSAKQPAQADPRTTDPTWSPTPEAKKRATKLRIFAWVAWMLAIAGEAVAIFVVLRQTPVNLWLLIGLIIVIGALAVAGSLLWKQANRLDPASTRQPVRFFVQNQLGAIVTMIAFLPLIILVFLNKDMDGKQKGIAGGIAIVVLLVAGFFGASLPGQSPSVEQYTEEANSVVELTGQDLVYWTKSGKVFHLCAEASAVNRESADNQIYEGTVADAHAAGKERLTKQVAQELKQCGIDASETPSVTTPDSPSESFGEESPPAQEESE